MGYSDDLKDWKWQEKRAEIIERDDAHCRSCNFYGGDSPQIGEILHVHHIIYKKGLKPWEYNNDDLITLCDKCHKFITEKTDSCNELIRRISVNDDMSEQLEFLLREISYIKNPWELRRIAKLINNG